MTPDVLEGGLAAFAAGVDGAAVRSGLDVPKPLRRALAAASDDDLVEAYWLSEGSPWHEYLVTGWWRVRIAQGRPLGDGMPLDEGAQ